MALNLDAWWDEPEYKVCGTFQARGYFILRRLNQFDAAKLRTVTVDLYHVEEKEPRDITKFEWKVIMEYMGARQSGGDQRRAGEDGEVAVTSMSRRESEPARGYECLVAKESESRYVGGRTLKWLEGEAAALSGGRAGVRVNELACAESLMVGDSAAADLESRLAFEQDAALNALDH